MAYLNAVPIPAAKGFNQDSRASLHFTGFIGSLPPKDVRPRDAQEEEERRTIQGRPGKIGHGPVQLLRRPSPQGQGEEDHPLHKPRRAPPPQGASGLRRPDRKVQIYQVPLRQLRCPPRSRQGQGQGRPQDPHKKTAEKLTFFNLPVKMRGPL